MSSFQYEQKDRGMWLYHKELAPNGKFFSSTATALELSGTGGWHESKDMAGTAEAPKVASQSSSSIVESVVADEKASFIESVRAAAESGEQIPYNEVFLQMTPAELKKLAVDSGLTDKMDLRAGIEKLRDSCKTLISEHNRKVSGGSNG